MDNRLVVVLIVLVQFVNAMDFVIVMPMGPDLALGLNFKTEYISWVTSAYTLSAAVVAMISSLYLDKFDRKTVLALSLIGMLVSTVFGGLCTNLNEMLAVRVLAGAFGGIAISIGLSIVADVVPEEQRGKALSMVMAGFPLSAILGIPLALYISEQLSWEWAFYLLSGFIGLVLIAVLIKLPSMTEHRLKEQGLFKYSELIRRPEMGVGVLLVGLSAFPAFLIVPHVSTIIQYNFNFPREYLTYLYLLTGIVNLTFVILTGKLADKLPATLIAFVLVAIFSVNLGAWLILNVELPVMAYHLIFFVTFTALMIPIGALTSKIPLPHQRAGFSALQSFIQHMGTGAGSMVSFMMVTSNEDGSLNQLPTLAITAIAISAFIPLWVWFVEARKKKSVDEQPVNMVAEAG